MKHDKYTHLPSTPKSTFSSNCIVGYVAYFWTLMANDNIFSFTQYFISKFQV